MDLKEAISAQETPEQIRAKLLDWWRADCADCAAVCEVIQEALGVDRSAALMYLCANRMLMAAHELGLLRSVLRNNADATWEQEEVGEKDFDGKTRIRLRRVSADDA